MLKKVSSIIVALIIVAAAVLAGKFLYAENLSVTARVVDTTISINGYTEPNSLVTVENFGVALGTILADSNGYFEEEFTPVDPGTYEISIYAEDSEGNLTNERTFTFTIVSRQVVELHNVILPPTVYPVNSSPAVGTPIEVRLLGKPNQTAYIVLQGSSSSDVYTGSTNSSGVALFSIPSSSLTEGQYDIYGYFEVAYPSDSFTFTLLPAPSATPTLTPTPTITVTPTPHEQPTGLPGPSATAGPATTTGPATSSVTLSTTPAVVIEPTAQPGCTFPISKLCPYDSNGSRTIELNGETERLIAEFIAEFGNQITQLDLNENGRIDGEDLSILLRYIHYPSSTIAFFQSPVIEDPGMCNAGSISSGKTDEIYKYITLLLLLNILLYLLATYVLRLRFGFKYISMFLFTGVFILLLLLSRYQDYSRQLAHLQRFQTSTTNTSAKGDLLTYEVLVSNRKEQINVFEVYINFDPRQLKVVNLDADNSVLPIISQLGFSNDCGSILIIGGLPQQVGLFSDKHLMQVTFEKQTEGFITEPNVSSSSKGYFLEENKSSIYPDVKIKQLTQ